MNTTLSRAFLVRSAAIAALPLAIVGCRSGYDVSVRNMTDQPIGMALTTPFGDGADKVLKAGRLGPGDRGSMFAQQDSKVPVRLKVEFAGNEGYPAVMDLAQGETVVNVKRIEGDPAPSKGRLRLEEVQRP